MYPSQGDTRVFDSNEVTLQEIDVHYLVEDRLCEFGSEQVQGKLLAMLGAIGSRVSKPQPSVAKLREDIKDGDIIRKDELLQHSDDGFTEDDLIHHPEDDPSVGGSPSKDEYLQVDVQGSDTLQKGIRSVIHKYMDVFTSTLPAQAARVTPLSLKVNVDEWVCPKNQGPHRRQSTNKDAEIYEQTRTMLDSKVIAESKQAKAWSQVLLTLKPNGKWRFCIDFRQLNLLITDGGWPLPRIDEVLERVGQKHPKIFGKMDLTSGYHQMPLAADSRQYTAFKTAHGLYEWLRVPMGLRNAAAYFQQRMATEVLNDIVHKDCELYLDDVLIHAQTEEQFLKSLEEILERFQARGIVLSPTKCSFGMSEVEILGHTVNSNGCHFSKEKLITVLDIKLPATGTQMHSFVGLCNYYRRHVKNISELEQPLRRIISLYPGVRKIAWDKHPEEAAAFEKMKLAVGNCPRLFFYNSHMPVYVHTDACNNGIGGYVFQKDKDGEELPIGFLSKSLKGAELGWSTFEQECFAIHQTLKKYSYLLRDINFTIRTDHRNLLYLNNEASPKVLRWKWDIQQYNFQIEHISGPINVAADLLSRLCVLQSSTTDEENLHTIQDFVLPLNIDASSGSFLLALNATRRTPTLRPWMRNNRPLDKEVYDTIQEVHGWGGRDNDGSTTKGAFGHGGVERTLQLLKTKVPPSKWWYTMRADVKQFIHDCVQCQFMQPAKLAIHSKVQIHPYNMAVGRPMERVNLDPVGPLPEDEDGNKYIIVLICVFSRFIELYAVPDLSALTAAKAIVEYVGRYGNPSEILTDNGTQYRNELANQIYDRMIVNHISIMPYSHEENSVVERANKEVNRHLRAIVFDRKIKEHWSMALPLLQRVMNTMVHSSTGVKPSQIIFGNAIDLDRHILHKPQPSEEEGKTYSEYVLKLLNVQAEIIARAQSIQEIVAQKHIARKLKTFRDTETFEQDDYVLWEYPESGLRQDSRPNRLTPHYRGPYRVIQSEDSNTRIQNLITMELHEVKVTQLKPFHYDPNIVDPTKVALQAQQEFLPERILAIDGKKDTRRTKRYLKTDLIVHVQWQGYSKDWNSWEPYLELKHTAAFKTYCQKHNLAYLLK